MSVREPTVWAMEPHTKAKHEILSYYLKGWLTILANFHRRLLYVDGFAGPGEYTGGEDGSPIVALKVALEPVLRNKLQRVGTELVFIFIEKDPDRYQNLRERLDDLQLPPNFQIVTYCNSFAEVFDQVLRKIEEQDKSLAPSFVFIDPFGPTGFPMSLMSRLAQQPRSEVLISFQYQSLNRWFLQNPQKHGHLIDLFGDERFQQALDIENATEKETFLRESYRKALEEVGWKKVHLFRMVNKHNQTQYYLLFATSHWRGSLLMKQAMWHAAPEGDFEYSDVTDPYPKLFELSRDEEYSNELATRLYNAHAGQTVSKEDLLQNDVAWDDVCIERHLTQALRILEYERKPPQILGVKTPSGKKRRQRTYPGESLITFAPKHGGF